ncbi:hypothetical protein O6P43_018251 [Quillaja saponaria]|uniref:Uncharacterized protein n=1 Tax=Quillaja saponaria TaxID=32244 RepID=A0AAD7PP82_QUISA|nr:hypothetical protein O6P43_018251 [Quillaja saponaria]
MPKLLNRKRNRYTHFRTRTICFLLPILGLFKVLSFEEAADGKLNSFRAVTLMDLGSGGLKELCRFTYAFRRRHF